jgi:hypothetical protein
MADLSPAKEPALALKNRRRAQALRDNLRRRKVQANARAACEGTAAPVAPVAGQAAAPGLERR